MIKIISSIMTVALLSMGCHGSVQTDTQTAATAKVQQDPRDAEIVKLKQENATLADVGQDLLERTQKAEAGMKPGTNPASKPEPAAPQRPMIPAGPTCGQIGPSVVYLDNVPFRHESCGGNCMIFHNDTDQWISIESPGGEKKLVCGGYRTLTSIGIDSEVNARRPIAISLIPPHRAAVWINHSGDGAFIEKFWHRELDGTFTKVAQHASAPIHYPNLADSVGYDLVEDRGL